MKLEDQVCSLDLAKRIKELGVKQESCFWWVQSQINNKWVIEREELAKLDIFGESAVSAFTVAELGELAKGFLYTHKITNTWVCYTSKIPMIIATKIFIEDDNEANSRGKMLVYLLENKLITL